MELCFSPSWMNEQLKSHACSLGTVGLWVPALGLPFHLFALPMLAAGALKGPECDIWLTKGWLDACSWGLGVIYFCSLFSRAGARAGCPEQNREVRAPESPGRGQPPWGVYAAKPQR